MKQSITEIFREESSKIHSTLIKIFGFSYLEEIEDAVQDTFISAFESWKLRGIPDNPKAWLYAVSKNKILTKIKQVKVREKILDQNKGIFPVSYQLEAEWEKEIGVLDDNTLRTLFALCHPSIPVDGQSALSLKILYGFTILEIANLFLTNIEVIQKRLYRAKQTIRELKLDLSLPTSEEIGPRIASVLKVLYLLFTQGYYGYSKKGLLQIDLMRESLRYSLLMTQNPLSRSADALALVSLISFHSSRLESRKTDDGNLVSFYKQDQKKWNYELIKKGKEYLTLSLELNKNSISDTQIEAMIAYLHTEEDTNKWSQLTLLYETLFSMTRNPMAYLGRIYAIYRNKGSEEALNEFNNGPKFEPSVFSQLLVSKLFEEIDPKESNDAFEKALLLTKSVEEKEMILMNRNRDLF